MLEIVGEAKSKKGHKMVKVLCSYCNSITEKRKTALPNINSCGCNANGYYDVIGTEYKSHSGETLRVVEVYKKSMVRVEFLGRGGFTEIYRLSHLKDGSFADPFEKIVAGVGYFGIKKKQKLKDFKLVHSIWTKMIKRCYDVADKAYSSYGAKGIYICDSWHCLKTFYDWYISQPRKDGVEYNLDKDLLSNDQNKVYSPETCCLLPAELNKALIMIPKQRKYKSNIAVRTPTLNGKRTRIGVYNTPEEADAAYKLGKENFVKELTQKYIEALDPLVYSKLISWEYKPKASVGFSLEWLDEYFEENKE